MLGPLLPLPICPQAPAPFPVASIQQALASNYGLVAIPDTMPLPSEAALRRQLASAIQGAQADHLAEWQALISVNNAGKRKINQYARIYPLQHFVRCLRTRHPEAFHRKEGALRSALAGYFSVQAHQIDSDLRMIARSLGPKWWETYPL